MNIIKKIQRIPYYRRLFSGVRSLVRQSSQQEDFLLWYAKYGSWIPKFRNRYAGEDCFLLANGPSLNDVDFNRINKYHLIGLNKIFLLFDRAKLDLTFHVAINSLVIQQSWKEFQKLGCPSFLSYREALACPISSKNIHLFLTERQCEPRFSHVYDEPVWEGWTVTYAALQLAYYMGFKNVFIVGMDHNFKSIGKPNEEQEMAGQDPNHFDPRYFANAQWHLPDLEGSEMGYRLAHFAFDRSGRGVFDATEKGKCKIFKRLTLEDAFSIAKKRA
jgi:hypothetical protein